jgi:hypothetical protein
LKRATLGFIVTLVMLSGVMASTALAVAPTATTAPATNVTATSATLNGDVVPNQDNTTYFFKYGTTTDYGTNTPTQPVKGNAAKSKAVSEDVKGLQPSTTYNYRLVATNSAGTSNGANVTFTTPAAGPGPSNALSIAAAPPTIIHGGSTVISGRLTGPKSGAVAVTLEQNPFPFTGGFKAATNATTDKNGNYSFTVKPTLSTRYRVSAKTSPPVMSTEVRVNVRVKVTLRVSDKTPAIRQRVRFSGLVIPAHDGKIAKIQRRTASGTWKTVVTARLKPALAVNGVTRSRYSRRLTIRRNGTYRVRVSPGDGDHSVGRSPTRRLVVH